MPNPSTLKAIRLWHHYLGVFIAPAVLFFSFTGFIQTFSLHETTRGSSYTPPAILVHLSQLHKKATLTVPTRKPTPPAPAAAPKPESSPAPAPAPAPKTVVLGTPNPSYHWPMKLFFAVVAFGLILSTFTGLTMAWTYNRSKLIVTLVFLSGILVPVLCLLF